MSIFGNNYGSHDKCVPKEVIAKCSSGGKQYLILEEGKRGPCAEKTTAKVMGGFDGLIPWLQFEVATETIEVYGLPSNCDPAILMLLKAMHYE